MHQDDDRPEPHEHGPRRRFPRRQPVPGFPAPRTEGQTGGAKRPAVWTVPGQRSRTQNS